MSAEVSGEAVRPGIFRDGAGRDGDVEAARPVPRLVLAPARGQELSGLLGGLAKLFLLDVNGTSLLTRRAAMEMKLIAVMLTLNFLFDLVVWTLLWNMVFSSGRSTVSVRAGVSFIAAVFCGLLFATIIFVYERQFMTADTYRRLRYVWWPVSLRLIVIAAAAAITTQPFEVMVFDGPIQRRIHEEGVRVEAHSRLRALEEAQSKAKGGLKGTADYTNLEDLQKKRDAASAESTRLKTEVETARSQMQSAQAEVGRAQTAAARARTRGAAIRASNWLSAARGRFNTAQDAFNRAEGSLTAANEDEAKWVKLANEARGVVTNREELAEQDVKRLQDWITQIRNAKAGQSVTENRDQTPRWEFNDQDYDFFQRLGVINDLYFGRSARWLDIPPGDRKKLDDLLSLSDVDENDPVTKERREADAHAFVWSYRAVICIAAVFPLLLLAFKGLLPTDLKLYYSLRAQQEAGNYEALRFRSTDNLSASYQDGDNRNGRY